MTIFSFILALEIINNVLKQFSQVDITPFPKVGFQQGQLSKICDQPTYSKHLHSNGIQFSGEIIAQWLRRKIGQPCPDCSKWILQFMVQPPDEASVILVGTSLNLCNFITMLFL